MDLTQEDRQHVKVVASETLDLFEKVAAAAKSKRRDTLVLGPNVLNNVNTMTSDSAIQRLGQINQANRESYHVLASEPAIARVVVADEEGEQRTYYIILVEPTAVW
jgi:hypothetical protein